MADLSTALMGIGAAFQGQAPQFLQQQQQRQAQERAQMLQNEDIAEKRKQTLFKDAAMMLANPEMAGSILADRTAQLNRFQDMGVPVDPRHTQEMTALFKSGDMQGFTNYLNNVVKAGAAYNQVDSMANMPASFRSLDMQAKAAGLEPGSQEYQRFMMYGGAAGEMGAAKTITYNNGTVVKIPRVGAPEVYGPNGELITDATMKSEALDEARKQGIAYEGDVAAAKAEGTGRETRAQNIITEGLAAADSTAVLRRSLELLDRIKTGGFARVALAARKLFGVEGAEEGELSANLGKAVLSQLRSTFGAAFTEREGARLEGIEANFGSSAESNRALLNNALAIAEKAAERAIRRAELRGDYETSDEIESALEFDLGDINAAFEQEEDLPGAGDSDPGARTPRVIRYDAQGNRING